jgi:hypothetical protein
MSGGFIRRQRSGDHQVVIFTFAGELEPDKVNEWNEAVAKLKGTFGSSVTGVTLRGDPTPAKYKARGRKS